jgi:hypothetical protein
MSAARQQTVGGVPVPEYLEYKQAAVIAHMSIWMLYIRLKGPDAPPHHRRGRRIYFPTEQFIEWASRDVIP